MFEEPEEADIQNIPSIEWATKQDKLRFLDDVIEKIVAKTAESKEDTVRIYLRDTTGLQILQELLNGEKYDYSMRLFARLQNSKERPQERLSISIPALFIGGMPYIEIKKCRN